MLKEEKQNVHAHFKDTFPVKNALQRKGETRISVEWSGDVSFVITYTYKKQRMNHL
jgi:hypothetical protein